MSAVGPIATIRQGRLCLPPDAWPDLDRLAWQRSGRRRAGRPSIHDPMFAGSHAGGRRNARRLHARGRPMVISNDDSHRRNMARGFGMWLQFLSERNGGLPPSGARQDLVIHHIDDHVARLRARCSAVSVHTYISRLAQALRLLNPEADWKSLANLVRQLTPPPPDPARRLDQVCHPAALFAAAEHLMTAALNRAGDELPTRSAAVQYRDGLLIAVAVFSALRRRSLLHLSLGTTLVRTDDGYTIYLGEEHTKARRPEVIPLHSDLTRWLDMYLQRFRPRLLGASDQPNLWIGEHGRPLGAKSLWWIVKQRTQALLGVAINPHFIRHCIATTMAIEHPEMITSLHVVLQHRDFRVTERHYILAQQLQAFARYGEALEDIRQSLHNIDDREDDIC